MKKKIFFLAQFAPTDGHPVKRATPEEEFYATTYHEKIYEVLQKSEYDFYSTNRVDDLLKMHSDYDLVWSLYNRIGFRNCEVFVQSLCEYLNIAYIGAPPNIRALVEDKSLSKLLAEHLGISTPKWVVASSDYPLSSLSPFQGPYFVKPRFGSASIGIDESCLCQTWEAATKKSREYFERNIDIIVEEFIDGTLYGVPILNTLSNVPITGRPRCWTSEKKGGILTYSQKRRADKGMTGGFSEDTYLNKALTHLALKYFGEMSPCDYTRVDFMVHKDSGIPYFLEVNLLMNLGMYSDFTNTFLESHFSSYEEIINHILQLGLSRVDRSSRGSK